MPRNLYLCASMNPKIADRIRRDLPVEEGVDEVAWISAELRRAFETQPRDFTSFIEFLDGWNMCRQAVSAVCEAFPNIASAISGKLNLLVNESRCWIEASEITSERLGFSETEQIPELWQNDPSGYRRVYLAQSLELVINWCKATRSTGVITVRTLGPVIEDHGHRIEFGKE